MPLHVSCRRRPVVAPPALPPAHPSAQLSQLQAATDQLAGACEALQSTSHSRSAEIAEVSAMLMRARQQHGLADKPQPAAAASLPVRTTLLMPSRIKRTWLPALPLSL